MFCYFKTGLNYQVDFSHCSRIDINT